ncbi:MAG TPA: M17 family peptidase N-terminal domain-containing protein [Bdellovibrionota bacterium]|nr:M17 family peptidase N-terminal domain-containing protein [Bdellovibrionota bacterium]
MRSERYTGLVDDLETDLIITTLFETDRPPHGTTGLIDWRLNGFLSRMILSGTLTGKEEEFTLIPLRHRLPARRLLLVGLGKPENFLLARARHLAYRLGKILSGLKVIDVAMAFPAAYDERIPGDTERSVYDAFGQASLPHDLFLHWIPPAEKPARRPSAKTSAQNVQYA